MQGQIKIEKIAIVTLLSIFLVYALFESYKILRGPVINIKSPKPYEEINLPFVAIEGETKNISLITLNDRQIFIDEDGVFREKLLLPEGYTIIELEAFDRFKKKVVKSLSIYRPYSTSTPLLEKTLDMIQATSTSTSTKKIIN